MRVIKYTLEEIQHVASSRGGKCLSTEYVANKTPLLWECSAKHRWEANLNSVLRGSWCPHCSGVARLTIEQMHEIAQSRGGECLSMEYINARTPLLWRCAEGHEWEAKPSNMITHGRWCPECGGTKKLTIEGMHQIAQKRGGKCLSNEYANGRTPLKWQCSEGHVWESPPKNISIGHWCLICSGNLKLTIEEMQEMAQKRGGRCLSTEYKNSHSKLLWECSEGHQWKANSSSIKGVKTWCPKCAGKEKTIDDLKAIAELRGGKLISEKYHGAMAKYLWECGERHRWEASANSIINSNSWCPTCSSGTNERVCRKVFELLFGVDFKKRKPKWLHLNNSKSRLELDGYAEETGVAFEYHGQQHYEVIGHTRSRKDLEKRQEYDQIKRDRCRDKGVVLIEVPYKVAIDDMEEFIRNECNACGLRVPRQTAISPTEITDAYLKNTEFLKVLQTIARGKGGNLIDNQSYKGAGGKLWFECSEGHRWKARPYGIKNGFWCPECAVLNRVEFRRSTIDDMQRLAEGNGGECLSDTYHNSNTKLKWQCAEGHVWHTTPNNVSSGNWCPKCGRQVGAEKRKHNMEVIHSLAQSRGGRCLSSEYKNNRTKLLWECEKGHSWETSFDSVKSGNWCPYCSSKAKGTIEEMQEISCNRGGKCLSRGYVNNTTKLHWQCNLGHQWQASPSSIKRGGWCPTCGIKKRNDSSPSQD